VAFEDVKRGLSVSGDVEGIAVFEEQLKMAADGFLIIDDEAGRIDELLTVVAQHHLSSSTLWAGMYPKGVQPVRVNLGR
jgi:hypothetical protein